MPPRDTHSPQLPDVLEAVNRMHLGRTTDEPRLRWHARDKSPGLAGTDWYLLTKAERLLVLERG